MLIVGGRRHYGKVDEHAGQYAITTFAHLWYLPLIPVDAWWAVQQTPNGGFRGHRIPMRLRNVAAGYARVWGPVGMIAGAATAGGSAVAGIAMSAISFVAAAWSWSQRKQRNAREQRRSDFHLVAYGVRCDPLHMSDELATLIRPRVEERWAAVAGGTTPEDIANRGTTDPAQAVLAYGVLRLAARGGAHADAARAASDRILDTVGPVDVATLGGGPYREPAQLPGAKR